MSLNTYCSHCGTKFAEQKLYPRKCFFCGNDTYRNPIPVAVGLIPVVTNSQKGILILRRGNEPKKGEWALPGGFIEYGETWQQGLAREIHEELSLDVTPHFALKGIENSTSHNMIIFGESLILEADEMPEIPLNDEVLEVGLFTKLEDELAFPTHTNYARRALTALIALYTGSYV